MIYTCQHCGAQFSVEHIREALGRKENFIQCRYCNQITDFGEVRKSSIARGYDHLSEGDFNLAMQSFSRAIGEASQRKRKASPDAYLGYALAQFRVQTIFRDDDPNRIEEPRLICHQCNEGDLIDNRNFRDALSALEEGADGMVASAETQRLMKFADTVDGIRARYNEIAEEKPRGFRYGMFIAYEDEPEDRESEEGRTYADKVNNNRPDGVRNVFLPDIEDYDNDPLSYEAAILYAIDNSACMVVITDNNIDHRLTNIYTRYYLKHKDGASRLAFVRFCDKINIPLPDQSLAENVWDIDIFDGDAYVSSSKCDGRNRFNKFVCDCNGVIYRSVSAPPAPEKPRAETPEEDEFVWAEEPAGEKQVYRLLPGRQFEFGSYPQRREEDERIVDFFREFDRPSADDPRGWTVMFRNRTGKAYTWYRDETVGGKRYRAVYFTKFRDVYSVQDSDARAHEQRVQGYMPGRVYCFAFMPLIWNAVEMSPRKATLCTDLGIESREFNCSDLAHDWEYSTIRTWLNGEFLETAFTEEEQQALYFDDSGEDRVFLMEKDFDERGYDSRRAILGSDYFKCIGGMCSTQGINSYWINSHDVESAEEAAVVYPTSEGRLASSFVDSTLVAVIPKIVLKL